MKSLISLDVFDTAIFRKVFYPVDILDLVEDTVGRNFKVQRVEAQNKCRRNDIYYTLADIYRYLPSFNPKDEIRAEYMNCEANPYILNMYDNIDSDFIFISDMYLPSTVIKSMLEKCGYNNPQVFVSCEHRLLKGDGRLFKRVEEILGRKIDKHIGDNYNADILGAKRAKINEVEFIGPPIYERKVKNFNLKSPKLRKFLIDAELSSDLSIEERIGYKFAPLALIFTRKVLEEATSKQTIFFNARDGFLLYVIARWLLKTNKKIKYCRFSRKSCHFPNINTNFKLSNAVNDKAMNFFRSLRIQKLRDFIEMFELQDDFSTELDALGVNLDSTDVDYSKDKNVTLLKFILLIQDKIYKKAREDRKNFLTYVKSLGMKNGDIFVDLGHFGSMQSIIRKISHVSLKGRYVHMFKADDYFKGIKEDKSSFLEKGKIALYTGIVELIFSEPVGTVVNYSVDGKPVLNKDKKFRKGISKKILSGVLKGAKKLIEDEIDIPYEDCIKVMMKFLEEPTLEEAQLGNSELFENGSYENNESIVWFNENYIKQGRLKDCYFRSYWKSAFRTLLANSKYSSLEKFLKL